MIRNITNTKNRSFLKTSLGFVIFALAMNLLSGCCTLVNTANQKISILSSPTGACVSIDDTKCGKTPLTKRLSRKKMHTVKIELEGYTPFEITMNRSISGWIWGNVIFGGLIGIIIDVADGSIYKLTPEQISTELQKNNASYLYENDQLYVSVALEHDQSWQKIGQLQR